MVIQSIALGQCPMTYQPSGGSQAAVALGDNVTVEITTVMKEIQPLGTTTPAYQVPTSRSFKVTMDKCHVDDVMIDLLFPAATPGYSTSITLVWTLSNKSSGGAAQTTTHTIVGKIAGCSLKMLDGKAIMENIDFRVTSYSVATA